MDKKIEIKEENLLTDDITLQNEREFFQEIVSMKTSTDAVLLDTDCDMTVKTEIKSETPFIKHFEKHIKTETTSCSNNCEIDRTNEVKQHKEEFLSENPEIMDKKYNSDHEMCNKIEIKEEPWQLETETSSVWDNTKDGNFPPVESSRLHPNTVAGDTNDKPPLLLAEVPARVTSFSDGIDRHEYKKCEFISGILTPNEYGHSDQCGKYNDEVERYIQPSNLKHRSLSGLGKSPQQCDVCRKSFRHWSQLKVHILIHEGKKPHQCKVCNKSFTQLSNLKRHNLVHEGKKPHQCTVCNKSFSMLSNLKRHNLIHEGKKPHQCKVCNKSFAQLSQLKRHNLGHEGKKAHQCKVCNKSFTLLPDLRRHNLVHEDKKSHQCKICNKSFTQLSDLKRHNLVHEGKKSHQCKVCNKSFIHLSDLKRHNLVHEAKRKPRCIDN